METLLEAVSKPIRPILSVLVGFQGDSKARSYTQVLQDPSSIPSHAHTGTGWRLKTTPNGVIQGCFCGNSVTYSFSLWKLLVLDGFQGSRLCSSLSKTLQVDSTSVDLQVEPSSRPRSRLLVA